MHLTIEPIQEIHFEGLLAALDQVAREKRYLAFTEAPPRDEAFAFYRAILANDMCLFVAVLDGRVMGWCDVLRAHGQARAHVGTLGIGLVADCRQMGIGAQLLKAAIASAWTRGLMRIELSVRTDNTNAKALYERFGFQVEGRMRAAFRVDGHDADGWSMALLRTDAPVD